MFINFLPVPRLRVINSVSRSDSDRGRERTEVSGLLSVSLD